MNRSPSYALEGDLPQYVWSGKKVNYSPLRVFGCTTFVQVPKEQRTKFDSKVIECISLVYGDDKFGYRLWDPKKTKLIWREYVVFKEDQTIGYS